MKELFFALLTLTIFSPYAFVLANVEINEIMYDLESGSDEGREWIEVFNNSDEEVDFSTFKFFEANTNHKLTSIEGLAKIPPRGYAVIVADITKFKGDWPLISLNIFDSSFSLSNSGEALVIKNDNLVIDEYLYQSSAGGSGNGKSLQEINGVWQGAIPTPGRENKLTPPTIPVQNKSVTKQIPSKMEISTQENLYPIPLINDSTNEKDNKNNDNKYIFVTTLIILVGIGIVGTFLIRKRKTASKIGDDFEIFEEKN